MKKLSLLALSLLVCASSFAFEGMWIPSVLNAAFDDMKANGLKLTADQIYSINHSSLKDGVVIFGGGCTGELVSNEGLLFTNHHCGFDYIQYHSSVEHDYLRDGFWAMSREEELACAGLTATFVVEMRDVTAEVLEALKQAKNADELASLKKSIFQKLVGDATKGTKYDAFVRGFNYNTQYFLVITKTYSDVRMVGAPPSCIGKFGGDTDNWVWPRHTGDFSVFRIYANAENEPAAYNKDNKPFTPKHFFPISLKPVKEGDFTMVYGFPGRTEHLLTSAGVAYNHEQLAPMRIKFREKNLEVIDAAMRSSQKRRIQYAAKQSDVANAYKKWKGQELGLNKYNAIQLKKDEEAQWQSIANGEANIGTKYSSLLFSIDSLYRVHYNNNIATAAYTEFVFYGPEVFQFYQKLSQLLAERPSLEKEGKWNGALKIFKAETELFYKDYDVQVDEDRFLALSPLFEQFTKGVFSFEDQKLSRQAIAHKWFSQSLMADSTKFFALLSQSNGKKLMKTLSKDYLYQKSIELDEYYNKTLVPRKRQFNSLHDAFMEKYIFMLAELRGTNEKWCDANSTLRLTYGKVEGSAPVDGMAYTPFTTGQGILDKNSTGNPDFDINEKLKGLLMAKSYGNYAVNGTLPVCFTGSNHTTGGNSGSPALNGNGELIGINFDRTWESTMSDIYFNSEICRNVMVDAHYVLWVIDVYAGAGHLVKEMQLVR